MRRKEREVVDFSEVRDFLCEQKVMRIAFCDCEGLYLLPVNYGVEFLDDEIILYFHGSLKGRKASAFCGISQDKVSSVSVEIDGKHSPVRALGCDVSFNYMSFLADAKAEVLEDLDQKRHALLLITSKLFDDDKLPDGFKLEDDNIASTLVVKLSLTSWSCKKHL